MGMNYIEYHNDIDFDIKDSRRGRLVSHNSACIAAVSPLRLQFTPENIFDWTAF